MLNYFYIYSNIALTYISHMLQIFDNDYVTLTPFSRSFKFIFFQTGFWQHIFFGLLNIATHAPTPTASLTQLHAYIYCVNRQYVCSIKDLRSQGGVGNILLSRVGHLFFHFWQSV